MEKMMKKMKKMFALMMVVAIVMCFSGCIRYKVTAKVNKDGTADFTFLYAQIDTSNMMNDGDEVEGFPDDEDEDEEDDDELRAKFEAAGWTVEDYADEENEEKKYYGYTATKNGIKLDDLQAEFEKLGISSDDFSLTEKDGVYTLDWDVSGNTEQLTEQGVESAMVKSYGGYMVFSMELPGKAKEENSTKSEKNVYEWDMLKMKEPIHCKFDLKGDGFPMWIIGVIAGGVIIVAGVIVAIVLISKKKKADAEAPTMVPVVPKDPTPAEKLAQTSFETSQTDGLPAFGQDQKTPAEDAPIWAQPSDASQAGSVEDLDDDSSKSPF